MENNQQVVEETEVKSTPVFENNDDSNASKFDKFFEITKRGSTVKQEIIAGLTTFMAMVYILAVNAGMFSEVWMGPSYGAAYIATAIAAIVGTLLMAFLAKMPLAQASGMGVNAFVVYTLCLTSGLSYANTMVFVLVDGIVFVLLTVTGLKKKIFTAIPAPVKTAITVGIGLFIAYIGFQNAGVIVDSATLSSMVSFNFLNGATYGACLAPFVCLVGVGAIAVLSKKNVKGAILWGILGAAAVYYAMAGVGLIFDDAACKAVFENISFSNPFAAFVDWGKDSLAVVFTKGFDFSAYVSANGVPQLVLLLVTTALSLCICDMFDTIGTLYGACEKGNLLDENGTPINMDKMMLADAIATCAGAVAGTSTVTTFVESSAGVSVGGKTGLTALVVACGFFVAMFLSPIVALIPSAATASALVWVGVLMMTSVVKINWADPVDAVVSFLTLIIMTLGYTISGGIGMGIVAYCVIKLVTGKVKEVNLSTWIIGAFFLAYFLLAA